MGSPQYTDDGRRPKFHSISPTRGVALALAVPSLHPLYRAHFTSSSLPLSPAAFSTRDSNYANMRETTDEDRKRGTTKKRAEHHDDNDRTILAA